MPYKFVFQTNDGKKRFSCNLKYEKCKVDNCPVFIYFGFPYCSRHLEKIHHVAIRPSSIPGIGNGLFALKRFNKGKVILEYTGENLSKESIEKRYGKSVSATAPYVLYNPSTKKHIDSACYRSAASYANHPRTKNEENAKFFRDRKTARKIVIEATKTIRKGDEIFVDYGTRYGFENYTHSTEWFKFCL
jgi:SET domain-containing protein